MLGGSPKVVVDHLSFKLYASRTLAIVGESGCGKSLAALSLMRLLPMPPALPSRGRVLYRGSDLLTLGEGQMRRLRGAKMAMIFQDPSSALNPVYTVGNQLTEAATLHLGIDSDQAIKLAVEALREVGIPSPEERMEVYPHQLSGGMRQRVMIAMALICKPDILIADEPTTALDVTIQAQVLALLRTLQRQHGMALLLITHDMGVVAEVADDVIVMYAGQGIEYGSVYEIFDSPSHPYTQALFAARPQKTQHGQLKAITGSVPPLGHFPQGCRFHPRCPYVMECCKKGAVPCFQAPGTDAHRAHCWLLDQRTEGERAMTMEKRDSKI